MCKLVMCVCEFVLKVWLFHHRVHRSTHWLHTCNLHLVLSITDLMQGVNPAEAFSSLPRSMQGMDELEDSSSLVTSAPTEARATQAWSLEREEVRQLFAVYRC